MDKTDNVKEVISLDSVTEKFKKETMTLAEFTTYVSSETGSSITENTIRKYLKDFCEQSGGRIKFDDFKDIETVGKRKGQAVYRIAPNLQGILAVMMCSDYFDGRRKTLSKREKTKRKIFENIEKYLDDDDIAVCKKYSPYTR